MRTSHTHTHTNQNKARWYILIGLPVFALAMLAPAAFWWTDGLPAASAERNSQFQPPRKAKDNGYLSRGGRHKITVEDPAIALMAEAEGGRVLADYGSYKLIEVDAETARDLNASQDRVELRDDSNLIFLNAGRIDTSTPEAQAERRAGRLSGDAKAAGGGKGLRLIQFVGPIKPEWYAEMEATGVKVITYIPNNTYLVYGAEEHLNALRRMALSSDHVQWDGEYRDEYKISPEMPAKSAKDGNQSQSRSGVNFRKQANQSAMTYVAVQLVKDPGANPNTIFQLQSLLGANSIKSQFDVLVYTDIIAAAPDGISVDTVAKRLSSQPDVVSVAPYELPQKMDERQNQIIAGAITGAGPTPGDYAAFLAAQGFSLTTPANFAVNVSDSGIDNATTNPNHFALFTGGVFANGSRVVYNRLEGTPNSGSTLQGCDGHGTINSHIIAGFVPAGTVGGVNFGIFPHADASGFRYGLGVAPFVKVGSSVIFDPDNFTFPNIPNLESKAYNDGARISSNSWGANVGGAYNINSQVYDALARDAQPAGSTFGAAGNQEYIIVFAAGNAGPGANTVGAPGTAKNVITAGASENVHPFGGADQCQTPDTGADSLNDVIGFSSRGPCDDGRIKPDLMAPGTHVSGGVFQQNQVVTGNGLAGACFNALGVCAGPGGSDFWPLNQQFYTASSGTSHSTPAIAGAAALVRQRFINAGAPPPSPAMTKAALSNSARYLTGAGANDNLFSNNQGMGLINLGGFFDLKLSATAGVTPTILRDQTDLFTASGQQRVITGNVADSTKPFRVTLVWTDPPGPTTGAAFINNLDLEVVIGGQSYKGNVFTGAFSATGGSADPRNNLESVLIPAGVSGAFAVTVKATNIAGDGVPGNASPLDQDFALVIYNANEVPQAAPVAGPATIASEDCATDGKLDPNEVVTVSLCVTNAGTLATGNLVGTLQPSGGVTSPSGAQTFGVIAPGETVCRSFTFRVSPALSCGENVVATLELQVGTTSAGAVVYTLASGNFALSAAENFDGVTAPALPAGWTAANAIGPAPLWATSTTTPDTAPNAAFVDDPAVISDKRLDSVLYNITSSQSRLIFRHNFNLESGFDGGVLEASVNSAAFVDVTNAAVGGAFTTGGYIGAISSSFSNPIGGRQAWTGNSGAYITTTVQFGAALQGKSVRFRWRMGSDTSFAGTGWRIDTIQLFDGFACCLEITPVVTLNDPDHCTGPGNNLLGTVRVTNPTSSTLTNGEIKVSLPVAQAGNPQGLPAGAPLLLGVDGCTATVGGAPVGTCSVSTSAITWTGSLAGPATLTINFIAQVGELAPSETELCAITTGGFAGFELTPAQTQTCITVNCTSLGPGDVIPTVVSGGGASPPSDQKPGSVLFYNIYTSSVDSNRQNTRISLTNIEPSRSAFVHIFFVDGASCSVADAFICLTANQTVSFVASDLDPGTTGYIVAVAVDRNGCPINFNYLIGDEYVKFASGHAANLGAESIPAVAGGFTACSGAFLDLRFDGINYAPVPRVLALDNIGSRADGNDTLIIINRVGGDLLTTADTLRNIFGVMYDDAENLFSFSVDPRACQYRVNAGAAFPRTTPRFDQAVPAGRTAWFRFYSTFDQGMFGAAINFNNFASSPSAFNQGHNLHKLSFTTSATYTIPVLPPTCQ